MEEQKNQYKIKLDKIEHSLEDIFKVKFSSGLKEGEPCPVCGSLEHPQPYKSAETFEPEKLLKERNKLKEKIDELEKQIKAIDEKINKEEIINKFSEELSVRNSLKEFAKQYYPDLHDIIEKNNVMELKNKLNERKKELENEIKEFDKIQEQIIGISEEIGKLEGEKSKLKDNIKEYEKNLEELEEKLENHLKQRGLKKSDIENFYIESEELDNIEKEVKEFDEQKTDIEPQKNQLYNQILDKLPEFNDNEIQQTIEQKNSEKAKIEKEIEDIKNSTSSIEEELTSINQEIGKLLSKIESLKKDRDEFVNSIEKYKQQKNEYDIVNQLTQILKGEGKNLKRISFDKYILNVYFDLVLRNANERLKSITNRYELFYTDEKIEARQKKLGLGIKVFDSYNGVERNINELSGGETFYVSLALALGLNDMFRQRTAGLEFDFLFVDEGFGSLDEGTLDSVISTLEEYFLKMIKNRKRQIGIITHVEYMKKRFQNQIIVKNQNGVSSILYSS